MIMITYLHNTIKMVPNQNCYNFKISQNEDFFYKGIGCIYCNLAFISCYKFAENWHNFGVDRINWES